MSSAAASLLTFLDAPVVVGDPDGSAAYLNPAFEAEFGVSDAEARGLPLAQLFEGGGREAVLSAVARVYERGRTERFRMRRGDSGYNAVASPIVAEDARVGVIVLFARATASDEKLRALRRELQEPLDEIARALDAMLEQTGGRRGAQYRVLVEDGLRALARVQKWGAAFDALLAGAPVAAEARCDPGRVLRAVAARLREACGRSGVGLEILLPARLPSARADDHRLESALVRLAGERVAAGGPGRTFTLSGRLLERGRAVCLSLVEAPAPGSEVREPDAAALTPIRALVESVGGRLVSTSDPSLGTATAIRLQLA